MVTNTLFVTNMIIKSSHCDYKILPKMSGYVKSFDETKYIPFLKDDELLKNIAISGIKSTIVLKQDLIGNQSTTKKSNK